MENIIILTIFIALTFLIAKLLENKYIENNPKPLKNIMRDSIIAAISSFGCLYIYFNFKHIIFDSFGKSFGSYSDSMEMKPTEIFTGNPGF